MLIGLHDLTQSDIWTQYHNVSKVIIHPFYNETISVTLNDIALMKLEVIGFIFLWFHIYTFDIKLRILYIWMANTLYLHVYLRQMRIFPYIQVYIQSIHHHITSYPHFFLN